MISRAVIQVTGPAGAGKTTLIERVLGRFQGLVAVARCVRDDSTRSFRESAPKANAELRRYRDAGASGAACFTYPAGKIDLERVFETRLLEDFSRAIVFEGEHDLDLGCLRVHVVPAPTRKQRLLVRKLRDRNREEREKAAALMKLLQEPDGLARYLDQVFGSAAKQLFLDKPDFAESARADLLDTVEKWMSGPPLAPTEHWSLAPGFEGIELAHVVVVNVRESRADTGVERLLADITRIRKNPQVFADVLGWRGSKTPITATAANLMDARHPGTRKAVARIGRAMRAG